MMETDKHYAFDLGSQMAAWDQAWSDRITEHSIRGNVGKFKFLVFELWKRAYLAPMEKLDIGCGPADHVNVLSHFNPLWAKTWTGVDLSQVAVKKAKEMGFNAFCQDIYTFNPDKKFHVFLLLDSLEHMASHKKLGAKIKELATSNYIVFGNIPLYWSKQEEHGVLERPMNVHHLKRFLGFTGCSKVYTEVHGIAGFPYMLFEASNFKMEFGKWIL